MSSENLCPTCQKELVWNDGLYKCEDCAVVYKKVVYCPDCEAELENFRLVVLPVTSVIVAMN